MKVAIIGSGNVGKALAGSATRAGHQVTLSANDPQHAEEAARTANARAARSSMEAVKDADLVVLAVPANKVDQVVGAVSDQLDGKVVIDVTNRLDMQEPAKAIDGTSMSEHIQEKAPRSRVVKAFNYAFASRMADPAVDGTNLDAYLAGDDEKAKERVAEFARSIGFRPIDAGALGMARALEALAVLNVALQVKNKWPWQSGWKMIGPTGDRV
jgi:8-hydroxy-5-deazaflavin:NADPH oxidoreductase